MEQLSQHTQSTHDKVLVLVKQAKEVAKGSTARYIGKSKLPEVEEISNKFNLIAKEQLLQCTG